jgi:transcriptional regulator with XRE-family HTH domain
MMAINPAQCRAARGLLDWSQANLAEKAGVGIVTVRQFEAGAHEPRRATLDVMTRAFQAAGVEFTNGDQPGVRLVRTSVAASERLGPHVKKTGKKRN